MHEANRQNQEIENETCTEGLIGSCIPRPPRQSRVRRAAIVGTRSHEHGGEVLRCPQSRDHRPQTPRTTRQRTTQERIDREHQQRYHLSQLASIQPCGSPRLTSRIPLHLRETR